MSPETLDQSAGALAPILRRSHGWTALLASPVLRIEKRGKSCLRRPSPELDRRPPLRRVRQNKSDSVSRCALTCTCPAGIEVVAQNKCGLLSIRNEMGQRQTEHPRLTHQTDPRSRAPSADECGPSPRGFARHPRHPRPRIANRDTHLHTKTTSNIRASPPDTRSLGTEITRLRNESQQHCSPALGSVCILCELTVA